MEALNMDQFTWLNLLRISIFLIAGYFLLHLASRLLPLVRRRNKFIEFLERWIKLFILIFEPVTIGIIASYFVLINPLYHGILMGLILLLGFNHLRNYFNGRIALLTKNIKIGQKLKIDERTGIVVAMDRLSFQLKTSNGIQTLGYSNLFQNGFMLLSGDEVGGYYNLVIDPIAENNSKNIPEKVKDLLATAPYIDHSLPIVLDPISDELSTVRTRIIVKEENHLSHLITLLRENDFDCKIVKK